VRLFPIALSYEARMQSCQLLNQVLADSMILHSHYKKHHWLVRGHTFYQLHLLPDKHAGEQLDLIDLIAERVQTLGGIAIADPRHVAEVTLIPRPPDGAEEVPAMLSRLLEGARADHRPSARRDHGHGRQPRRRHQRPAHERRPASPRAPGVVPGRAPRGHHGNTGLNRAPAGPDVETAVVRSKPDQLGSSA
jgi:DNA-binding ferritin-like protein